MSSVIQEEDFADSGKDDENNAVTATTDSPGSCDAPNFDMNLNSDISNITEQPSSSGEATSDIPQKLCSEKPEEKSDDNTNCAGDSELTSLSINKLDSIDFQNDNIEIDTITKGILGNVQPIADSQVDSKNVDTLKLVAETGYKETELDNASDSEIELRWSDDEGDDEMNAAPLSDEALKRLDRELGIADVDKDKDTEELKTVSLSTQNLIETENNSDPVTLAQISVEIDSVPNNSKRPDNTIATTEQCSMEIDDSENIPGDNIPENVEPECNTTLNLTPKIDQNNEPTSQPIKEQINLVKTHTGSNDTEPKVEIELGSQNTALKVEHTIDADISETTTSELNQSLNDENLTHLDKGMNVDVENKISEIDIDETIVDLKHLIDQDEDTMKQLGLDVEKSNDNDEETLEAIEKEKQSIQLESLKSDSELAKDDLKLVKTNADSTIERIEDVKLVDEKIPTEVEHDVASIANTSIDKEACEIPTNPTQHIAKSISISENQSDVKILNDQKNDVNDILENVSKIVTDKTDQAIGDSTTSEELSSVSLKDNDNAKDISQMPEDIADVQCEVASKVAIEEHEIDKTEETLVVQVEKYNTINENILKTQTEQNLLENKNNVENTLTQETGNVIDTKINNSKIVEKSRELNIDSCTKNISTITDKNTEEFITPDEMNDSIKINTKHRIKRPDVMLDIPTQELDFDDLDGTSEMQGQLVKTDKIDSDLTSKTVTEIVNQLSKNIDTVGTDDKINNDQNTKETTLDSKIKKSSNVDTTQDGKESDISMIDIEMTSIEHVSNKSDKVETETNKPDKIDVEIATTSSTTEKDVRPMETIDKPEVTTANVIGQKTKSTEHLEKPENFDVQPSTSTDNAKNITEKVQISKYDDKMPKLVLKPIEKLQNPVIIDPQPSTSEGITEETHEVTDSLGLLAESSRVMDDDDDEEQEVEEDEADDGEGDDDDDFDPDDDNSNPTEEHSEESNPPHSEVDIQEEGIDIEFNNEADKMGIDSNDPTFDTLLGDSTDMTVDNEAATDTGTVLEEKEAQQEIDSKSDESSEKKMDSSPKKARANKERRSSILADLLTKPAAEMNKITPRDVKTLQKYTNTDVSNENDANIVDLESSSSEDDVKDNQQSHEEAPSVAQKAEIDENNADVKINAKPEEKNSEVCQENQKTGEVFNLDSDDDDRIEDKPDVSFVGTPRENNKCINYNCTSDESVSYYLADRMTIAYYGAARRRKRAVCQNCLDVVNARNEGLVSGIKDLRPLMALRMSRPTHTLLEISDSDSEGEDEPIGEDGARLLEDELSDIMNEVWQKYNMDDRLKSTENYLEAELEKMQEQSEEVDKLLRDCQKATDDLRTEFYSSFEEPRHELDSLSIHDTPIASYACSESEEGNYETAQFSLRYPKRRSTTTVEVPTKKQALPFDDRKITRATAIAEEQVKMDEDRDISVVRLSAEAAPPDLPPSGELVKPPLRVGIQVYAMKNQYGAWLKGKVLEIQAKTNEAQYTLCRIRFEHKVKNPCKTLSARSIAFTEPSEVRMTIGTRVIALFKNSENTAKRGEFYYSGVIAEIPNPVNGYRYLVFFDDGYAQYVEHRHTRLVYESKTLVWEEVHPFSRDFVCNYLMKYPERPMVRMHPGQEVNVEWNGKWWDTKVIKVDAALVHVQFPDNRTEWIYRGSTRLKPLFAELLAAKRGDRARLPRSTKSNTQTNVPYVEYTRSDDHTKTETQSSEDLRRQRTVAKKSTTIAQQISNAATDGVISRVVFYTPKNSVRPLKMVPHSCGLQCRRSDLLSLKDLRTYNPLTKPLLSGWERQIVRHKASRTVMYRAPCGRRLRCLRELHVYLRAVRSDMPVDLFDFNPNTHCLAEFLLNKTNVQKKDLSHGKENVPVPCVNYYDHSLPEFCSYNTERTPTAGVPLNLDPEFLCGCDCDDDCVDKTKCACWKMTLEGAKTIGMEGPNIGYHYRRLPEPLPSGIYECNSRCRCKSTCLNRVVQNPLQLKLQVFKTLNRGWGIRALNDVPKGAFICIYAGNLLTDATANLDGLNEGDEYLAELDYIEVVESMKEGYEDDIPEADKVLDKKETKKSESEPESGSTDTEEEIRDKSDIQDGDFQPGYLSFGLTEFNKRLRRRDKKKSKEDDKKKEDTSEDKSLKKEDGEEYITISDDEEVRVSQREPSRFAAQENMPDNKIVSKYRSIRSYFGEDEACYIMDAKVQGNIGRYLNHSCSPNVFVQNVFVDTHDPRFPWVSFFALHHIRAGTELTWNYNYDIGSVPGKVLYCYCGAPNCRGRLL